MHKAFFGVIPADVLFSEKISPGAKILYAVITSLCNDKGFCWATNSYLAGLFNVTERAIQKQLESLQDNGFIIVDLEKKISRKIFLTERGVDLKGLKIGVNKSSPLGVNRSSYGGEQKFTHNKQTNNSSFPREKEEIPIASKRGKKIKYPGEQIFDVALEKYSDVVTLESLKKHKAEFIEYFTEGDGSVVKHVNWPLTFKKWVERGWGVKKESSVSQRVVPTKQKPCDLCAVADKVGRPCPQHGGKTVAKANSKNVQSSV